jgi:hypothetical protein
MNRGLSRVGGWLQHRNAATPAGSSRVAWLPLPDMSSYAGTVNRAHPREHEGRCRRAIRHVRGVASGRLAAARPTRSHFL